MKYNSTENFIEFFKDQMEFCKRNGYRDFTVWSNGKELYACIDTISGKKPLEEVFRNGHLKCNNYHKVIIVRDFRIVEI